MANEMKSESTLAPICSGSEKRGPGLSPAPRPSSADDCPAHLALAFAGVVIAASRVIDGLA